MKLSLTRVLLAFMLLLTITAPVGTASDFRNVLLDDRFAGSKIDEKIWTVTQGVYAANDSTLREHMKYSEDALRVGGGLEITARTESSKLAAQHETFFVSGRIQSRRSFLFGHFEFSAKLPRGRGLWPALWLRTPMGRPLNGEIDVLEGIGSTPSVIQSTLHPWIDGHETQAPCILLRTDRRQRFRSSSCLTADLPGPDRDLTSEFHRYSVDWRPDRIVWSIDEVPYFSVAQDIPSEPMVIVINLSVSSRWDGRLDDSTNLPQSLIIKSVSVTE